MTPLRTLATIAALAALSATATADTIRLGERPGGYVHAHIDIARRWLKQGHKIIITGDQLSAAAIQVAWYRANGGTICARPGIALFFHEGARGTNPIRRYLGYNLKPGWYSPGDFGIHECRSGR
jgi:hypothetical protein